MADSCCDHSEKPDGPEPARKVRSFKAGAFRFVGLTIGLSGLYSMTSVCPFCGRPGCPAGAASAGLIGVVLASLMQWGRTFQSFMARTLLHFVRWCRGNRAR
jgi:hypothetical protein